MRLPSKDGDSSGGPATNVWPSTLWNLVQRSRDGPPEHRKRALDDLFRQYYKPVFRFFQKALRVDPRHVDDVTQDFFTRFVEKDFLRNLDRKESFRGFLKVACRRHYINWMEAQRAAKRGEGRSVTLDNPKVLLAEAAPSEAEMDGMIDDELRAWYLEESAEQARRQLIAQGKELYYKIFEARTGFHDRKPATYKALSKELGIPVFEVCNHLLAARKVFRRALVQLAGQHAPDGMEELRELGLSQYLT